MYLETTCTDVTIDQWEKLMANNKPCNYDKLVRKIKKELPDLYNALCLNLYNPWWEECAQTETHYILVQSAIEYFIRK